MGLGKTVTPGQINAELQINTELNTVPGKAATVLGAAPVIGAAGLVGAAESLTVLAKMRDLICATLLLRK